MKRQSLTDLFGHFFVLILVALLRRVPSHRVLERADGILAINIVPKAEDLGSVLEVNLLHVCGCQGLLVPEIDLRLERNKDKSFCFGLFSYDYSELGHELATSVIISYWKKVALNNIHSSFYINLSF